MKLTKKIRVSPCENGKLPRNPPEPEMKSWDLILMPWRSPTETAPSGVLKLDTHSDENHGELQMPNLRSQGSQSLYFHSKKEQIHCLDDFACAVMLFGPKSSGKLRVQQHQPV
jgi:hypothetical protein